MSNEKEIAHPDCVPDLLLEELVLGKLEGESRVSVDEHLGGCDLCRSRRERISRDALSLREVLHQTSRGPVEGCFSDEAVAIFLDGGLEAGVREDVVKHAGECVVCQEKLAFIYRETQLVLDGEYVPRVENGGVAPEAEVRAFPGVGRERLVESGGRLGQLMFVMIGVGFWVGSFLVGEGWSLHLVVLGVMSGGMAWGRGGRKRWKGRAGGIAEVSGLRFQWFYGILCVLAFVIGCFHVAGAQWWLMGSVLSFFAGLHEGQNVDIKELLEGGEGGVGAVSGEEIYSAKGAEGAEEFDRSSDRGYNSNKI